MVTFTKPAEEIFAPTTPGGAPRGADMGDTQTWAMEVEAQIGEGGSGGGNAWNVQVANIAARAAYDGELEGFSVLVSNIGDGRAGVYSKLTDSPGDWSAVAYFTGATGGPGTPGTNGTNGTNGTSGTSGTDGSDGEKGWSPLFSAIVDGSRRVLAVFDWVGGVGVKPTDEGYLGAAGLVADIASATDFRGATGASGAGTGDMQAATYDPGGKASDAFSRLNHSGTQAMSTIDGLSDALAAKVAKSANLSDLGNVATGRSNLDVYSKSETDGRVTTLLNTTAETTLDDADRVFGGDSANGFAPRYSTWAQVKAFLKTYFDTLYAPKTEILMFAVSDETTALTTGTAKLTFRMPGFIVSAVRASVTTASSSGLVTFDINKSGVSILSTKLSVDAGEKTSTTAATAAAISDPNIADDTEMTVDIDAAGTGATGAKVYVYGRRT
jgi:hypothetical protein